MNLYREESSNPKWNAQRNLQGRTHYVDDDTLRFHHSKVLSTFITDNGLLFSLVESCALDMNNTKRCFRYVIFNIFGTVVERQSLKDSYSSRKVAERKMWRALNELKAVDLTLIAIGHAEGRYQEEMQRLRNEVRNLQNKAA